jgi:hypothetical protein
MTDFDPKLPYNSLPELPPPIDSIETKEILKTCIKSRVALAEPRELRNRKYRHYHRQVV